MHYFDVCVEVSFPTKTAWTVCVAALISSVLEMDNIDVFGQVALYTKDCWTTPTAKLLLLQMDCLDMDNQIGFLPKSCSAISVFATIWPLLLMHGSEMTVQI